MLTLTSLILLSRAARLGCRSERVWVGIGALGAALRSCCSASPLTLARAAFLLLLAAVVGLKLTAPQHG